MHRIVRGQSLALLFSCTVCACSNPQAPSRDAAAGKQQQELNGIDSDWDPEGPAPILGGQAENLQNSAGNIVAGAIHTVVAHPSNADRLVIGAVNGGVWTTTNATSDPPHWVPRTNTMPSQSIGAMDMDPADTNRLLAGFGRTSSKFDDSEVVRGRIAGNLAGLIISPNFGDSWSVVEVLSLLTPVGRDIWSVALRGSVMVVGDRSPAGRGVLRSADDGQNWDYPDMADGSAFPSGAVLDIAGNAANPDVLYAVVQQKGVYRSDDAGETWEPATGSETCGDGSAVCFENLLFTSLTAGDPANVHTHAEMAMAGDGRVYIGSSWFNQPTYIGYSDDGGQTWTNMDLPRVPSGSAQTITAATNDGNPIRFTTASPHGINPTDNTRIRVIDVEGNLNANGDFTVSVPSGVIVDATNDGNPIVITTSVAHGLTTGSEVLIDEVEGNAAANGRFAITVVDNDSFTLTTCLTSAGCSNVGSGAYTGDGSVSDLNGLMVSNCYTFPGCSTTGSGAYTVGGTLSTFDGTNPREDLAPGGQAGIHFSIGVDPTDSDIVYVGGDRQNDGLGFNGGINVIGADDKSGSLWRGNAAEPASGSAPGTGVGPSGDVPSPNQWEHLTHDLGVPGIEEGGTPSGSSPHADSRDIAFDANNDLIEVDDGGIYLRKSPTDNTDDWYSINGDLQITELHSLALDPLSGVLFGGAQDNGNSQQSLTDLTWPLFRGGDGADVAVDTISFPGVSMRYTSSQDFGGPRRCGFDSNGDPVDPFGGPAAPNSIANVATAGSQCIRLQLDLRCGTTGGCGALPEDEAPGKWPFVTQVELNVNDAANNALSQQRLVITNENSLYESLDGGDTIFQVRNAAGNGSGGLSRQDPLVAGHPMDSELLYVGGTTLLMRNSATGTLDATATQPPGGRSTGIALDPADQTVAYVASASAVSWTDDYGATFDDITGDLFDEDQSGAAGVVRGIAFVPGTPSLIYVGTNAGVFVSSTNSLRFWNQVGAGNSGTSMPNAITRSFVYESASDTLYVGTFGRGAFSILEASSKNLPPAMQCVATPHTAVANGACLGNVEIDDIDDDSFDPEGLDLDLALENGTDLTLGGPHTVTLTGTDTVSTESCTVLVQVVDETPPEFVDTELTDIVQRRCDVGTASVAITRPTATDNCEAQTTGVVVTGTIVASTNPAVPVPTEIVGDAIDLPPGQYTVEWTVVDAASNPGTTILAQFISIGGAIHATESIYLRNENTTVTGGMINSGSGVTSLEINTHAGDILSVANVTLLRDATAGFVVHENDLTVDPEATIAGSAETMLDLPPTLDLSGVEFLPPVSSHNVNPNDPPLSLPPDSYGTVYVNGTLVLEAGEYFFQNLTINDQGQVVTPEEGTVIYTQAMSNFQGSFVSSPGGDLSNVFLGYTGTSLNLQTEFFGTLVAPDAYVNIGTANASEFSGSLHARVIDVRNQASFTCDDVTCFSSVCGDAPPPVECADGVLNGDETDVDCGGSCDPCIDGADCLSGDDCESGVCPLGTCLAASCTDEVLNGDEEDTDCGGSCPDACPTCMDGAENGDEEGVDCGGSCPLACATCTDLVQNGGETGVDCGGPCPNACAPACNVQTYQAEMMSHSSGSLVTGGWALWENGNMSTMHNFNAGPARVIVRARATLLNGVGARMVVAVGGTNVGTMFVTSTTWASYTFPFTSIAGNRQVRVTFDNDAYAPPQDRNLFVDNLSVDCGPPATSVVTATISPPNPNWTQGYCVTIAAKNNGTTPISNWSVTLNTNQSAIYQDWNGLFSGTSGVVTVVPEYTWNRTLDPGETDTSIGFCANRNVSGSGVLPIYVSASP